MPGFGRRQLFTEPGGGTKGNPINYRVEFTAHEKSTIAPAESMSAAASIERALGIYQQMKDPDRSVCLQARKILTQQIYAMFDRGERDEQRLRLAD